MPEPAPEDTLLNNIKLVRKQLENRRVQLNESRGHFKTDSERAAESVLISEAKLLAKAAFSLGPAGEVCSCCTGTGRS